MASTWLDLVKTDYVISMGDGQVFTPVSLTATWNKRYDFNISQFNFKDVAGTLVKRGQPMGNVYSIEIIFQGDDNIDVADSFEKSSKDPGAWTITHPFYGKLYVQPLGLAFNNGKLNQSIITGDVMVTLLDSGLAASTDAAGAISAQAAAVNTKLNATYVAAVPEMKVSDLQKVSDHITAAYKLVSGKIAAVQSDVNTYTNYYNAANAVLNATVKDTANIIVATQNLLFAPANFTDTVLNRANLFIAQLGALAQDVTGIVAITNAPTAALKKLYENNAGTAIAGLCAAAITNITTDYNYRPDVLNIISLIIGNFNSYLVNLYTLQSVNGGGIDGYIPDADSIISMGQLVNQTTSALFTLSAAAKQQRTYVVPYDTSVLLVAFELYPDMNADDATDLVIANNNIGISELLVVKKGRQIIYYV